MTTECSATPGRVWTVLIQGAGEMAKAVVSALTARLRRRSGRDRLIFQGPVVPGPHLLQHYRDHVLPVADQILELIWPRKRPKYYEVSIANLGAASSMEVGCSLTGFSADVPVLLALVSAALKIPLPQDILTTGHVASTAGDIRAVHSLPAKLEAVLQEPGIRRFIHPALEADSSLQVLSPVEQDRATRALVQAREQVLTTGVSDISQLFRAVIEEDILVLASLQSDFFAIEDLPGEPGSIIDFCVHFLAGGNEHRFCKSLEAYMLAGESALARKLLAARARYQVRQEIYPDLFGRRLLQLARSLPPAIRRLKFCFPLLPMSLCLQMARLGTEQDPEDVQLFLDAVRGNVPGNQEVVPALTAPSAHPDQDRAGAVVETVLREIGAEALARKIGKPVDAARASFVLEGVTLDSYDAYLETLSGFYLHLLRHIDAGPAAVDPAILEAEALDLVDRAFADQGGNRSAWAEVRHGIHGGLRFVLDVMTEHFKTDQHAKHVSRMCKEALDPLDWEDRVRFMRAFLARLAPDLPPEIRSQPPERFARHHETIIRTYVRSLDRVKQLLQRF